MRVLHVAAVIPLTLAACSPTFESLPRPALFFGSGGNCTSTSVVDARGDIWNEHGCEAQSSGVVHRGRLTDAQLRAFRAALTAALAVPDLSARGQPPCSQPWELIRLVRSGAPDRAWCVCLADDGSRPAPFEALFAAMR